MTRSSEALWDLDELCAHVARALAADYAGQASGRVRDVPDQRTIRYYTTLRLMDRPVAVPGRGRTAFYGRRHLLQLVAIKRLQAQGLSLVEVQAKLVGQTDAVLEEAARLPAGWEEAAPADAPVGNQPEARREAFWKTAPAAPREALLGVPLAEGVTLLLRTGRPLDEHDLEALREAAAPLLKLLEARHLLEEES